MSASVAHEFREVAKGEWRRNLYGYERGVWPLEQVDGTFTIIVQLTAESIGTKDLLDAWTLLPFAAPVVFTRITNGPDMIPQLAYSVPTNPDRDLAEWSAKTSQVKQAMSLEDLSRVVASRQPAAAEVDDHHVARLYLSPNDVGGVHVVLAALHSVVDGRGAWMILHALFSLLATKPSLTAYNWNSPHVQSLPVPFQFAAGLRSPGKESGFDLMEHFSKLQINDAELAPFTSFKETPPERPLAPDASTTVKARVVVPASDYEAVHKIAKSKGVTATAWLSVCVALVALSLNNTDDARTVKIRNASPDGRWRLGQEGSRRYLGMSILISSVDIKELHSLKTILQDVKDKTILSPIFWDIARSNNSAYQALKHDDANLAIADELVQIMIKSAAVSGTSFDRASTSFISLGIVEDFLRTRYQGPEGQAVTLHEFRTFPTLGRRRLISIHAFLFRGDLHVRIRIPIAISSELQVPANKAAIIGNLAGFSSLLLRRIHSFVWEDHEENLGDSRQKCRNTGYLVLFP